MVEFIVRENVDVVLVSKDTSVILPVCKVGVEWRRDGAINGLKGREGKGVMFGAQFDMVIEGSINDINKEG